MAATKVGWKDQQSAGMKADLKVGPMVESWVVTMVDKMADCLVAMKAEMKVGLWVESMVGQSAGN